MKANAFFLLLTVHTMTATRGQDVLEQEPHRPTPPPPPPNTLTSLAARALNKPVSLRTRLARTRLARRSLPFGLGDLPVWDCAYPVCAFQFSRLAAMRNTAFLLPIYDEYTGRRAEQAEAAAEKLRKSLEAEEKTMETFRKMEAQKQRLIKMQFEKEGVISR